MSDVDIDHLRRWTGREEQAADIVTPGLCERFRATFGGWLYESAEGAPFGLHWCLAPPAAAQDRLGPDGHPARGGFLPPVPYPNRMWAGGEISFHKPLLPGDEVERRSRIGEIKEKEGRSGALIFTAVEHQICVGGEVRISERHDIVYRPARALSKAAPLVAETPEAGEFAGDAVMLMRYSAMTFNGHRIHYDFPYVTETEGYPGLVVHGPLQATLLMNEAARRMGGGAFRFSYRGLAPLIAGQAVRLRGDENRLWLERRDGQATFEARFFAPEG